MSRSPFRTPSIGTPGRRGDRVAGGGRITITTLLEEARRFGRLALLSLVVGAAAWGATLSVGPSPVVAGAEPASRVAPVARGSNAGPSPAQVTVEIDGLGTAASAAPGQSVRALLATLGVTLGPGDRVSADPDQPVVPGMRLAVDRGLPVTLRDGTATEAFRAPRGTVGGLLAARGLVVGPLDVVEPPAGSPLLPGSVITITRVAEQQVTERIAVPFAVERVADPNLEVGRRAIETAGAAGEAVVTWRVITVNGAETERVRLTETQVRAPVAEVWRVGSRPRPAPPAPAEIEKIIRDAAARWGANPEQLLRVAWCESRFDPNAYNPSHGDSGLFQFIPGTWRANSPRAGYPGASPFDPVANANTAAMMFANDQAWQWTCK